MFSFKYAGVLAVTIFSVLAQSQEVQTADKSAAIASLAGQISSCSVFQQRLRFPQLLGDGIDKPYMPLMRKERIKRIVFEFSAVWRDHKVTNIRLEQRLYFSAYDDSNSQITDLEHLKRIANSEMEKVVEDAIMQNAASASFFHGIHSGPKKGANGRALIELLDNAWLIPGHPPVFFSSPEKESAYSDLFRAAYSGDTGSVKSILAKRPPSIKDLNQALHIAARSTYDNTSIIEALLNAGADINSLGDEISTPLMDALTTPCNLQTLIRKGANIHEQIQGVTALDLAKRANYAAAIPILEEASRKH